MKKLFKQVRVIFDAHQNRYDVEYKNFLIWHYDSCYKIDGFFNKERAESAAIDRAKAMLETVEVFRG